MAFVIGGKHFGQYTYEHWFDDEYEPGDEKEANASTSEPSLEAGKAETDDRKDFNPLQ